MEETLLQLKLHMDPLILIVEDLNKPLPLISKSSIQKLNRNSGADTVYPI